MHPLTQILLIRHGETDDNKQRRFQGHGGSRLNAVGNEQAARLANRLKGTDIAAVHASDLDRAFETASAIAETHGLQVAKDARLREVDVGKWQGRSGDEISVLFPDEWSAWRDGRDISRGGGETYEAVRARVIEKLIEVASLHVGHRVAVVSHGGAIKSVVAWLISGTTDSMRMLTPVENTGITFLETAPAGSARPFVVRSFNDVAHLRSV